MRRESEKARAESSELSRAAAYLEGLINIERMPDSSSARFSLLPIQELMGRLGDPQAQLSILHVAGSKGKGSTCLFSESILAKAGATVGTFTSPHLERWTERFRIGGEEVAPGRLAEAVDRIRPHVELLRRDPRTRPSFFDATTAVALLLFAEAKVDHAVIEVGLGGRLDSTNIVSPRVTCVTNIELEHTDKLGETVEAIAGEKAGILKPEVPCIMGSLVRGAADVVRQRARSLQVPLEEYGVDFEMASRVIEDEAAPQSRKLAWDYRAADGFTTSGTTDNLGLHQLQNVAMAITAVRRLDEFDDEEFAKRARSGVANAHLPGRVEVLCRDPWVVVDSAHTAASASALVSALDAFPPGPRHLVLSVSADKQLDAILSPLLRNVDHLILTRADPHRSLGLGELSEAVHHYDVKKVEACEDPRVAVRQALASLRGNAMLCVTGSVYMAGIAREVLRHHLPVAHERDAS